MRTLDLKIHTIIMLVGPSNCGKSRFAKRLQTEIMNEYEKDKLLYPYELRCQYISSDAIRAELVGKDIDKYDAEGYFASQQAFDFLYNKVDFVTQYPINSEFVIVDTTGLQKEFRSKIGEIATKNNYKVVIVAFDYKDRDDYFKFHSEDNINTKFITKRHVNYFKDTTVKELSAKYVDSVFKLRNPDEADAVSVTLPNLTEYKSHYLSYADYASSDSDKVFGKKYYIIGDIHGCYDDLVRFIKEKCELNINEDGEIHLLHDKEIILIGDLIDKGKQTREVIEFVYKNINKLHVVRGNHENFVYKHLKGEIKGTEKDVIDEYFDTVYLLKEDEELRNKFFTIVDKSKDFFFTHNFHVCHAPCEARFLGKVDERSLKEQRNLRLDKREKDFEDSDEFDKYIREKLKHLKDISKNAKPIIYGHFAYNNVALVGGYYGIDTGCVYGNYLTGVVFENKDTKPKIISLKSSIENENVDECLIHAFDRNNEFVELDDFEKKRIGFILKNKINYISGTMCPCDKTETELEDLSQGLKYYKSHGINNLVLQPKYMGSRLQVYLNCVNPDESFAVTRNGFKLRKEMNDKLALAGVFVKLFNKFITREAYSSNKYAWIILDGEILPWSFLGEGLITGQYLPIKFAVERELQFLENNGFEKKLEEILAGDFSKSNFKNEIQTSKKELRKKFGDATFTTYENFMYFYPTFVSLDKQKEYYKSYAKQIDLFCSLTEETYYKPFSILKIVEQNGEEHTYANHKFLNDNYEMFKLLNSGEDNCIELDLNDDESLDRAKRYFDFITRDKNMEGIVLKPRTVKIKNGVAPYLKCRNDGYLTLVYGYDYKDEKKYSKLVDGKGVKNKLRTSISEFNIGQKMIQHNINELESNKKYKKLVIQMIKEERKEKEFDPRL